MKKGQLWDVYILLIIGLLIIFSISLFYNNSGYHLTKTTGRGMESITEAVSTNNLGQAMAQPFYWMCQGDISLQVDDSYGGWCYGNCVNGPSTFKMSSYNHNWYCNYCGGVVGSPFCARAEQT